MTVDTETTRTPGQDDGDAGDSQKTGTPGTEGRDAQGQGSDLTKLNMEWKGKAETLNALFSRYGVSSVEELNEALAQSPAAPATTGTDADDDEALMEQTRAFAAKGDPVAKLTLKVLERNAQLERGVVSAFEARDIADPGEREQAIAHFNKNRHRLGDVKAALAEVRQVRLSKELRAAQDELATLKKTPDPDVMNAPKTAGREIPSNETKTKKVTLAKFDAEVKRLEDAGQFHAAMLYKRDTDIAD